MKGKLYGIGVGPGDPELLTLKAKRILDEADIIAVPVKEAGEESTALEIIRPVVELEQKHLREFIRILGYASGCCLTCHTYAVG